VPFRNSKLTFLLQDSLAQKPALPSSKSKSSKSKSEAASKQGSAKVQMFVNASPAFASAQETAQALGFAKRCRAVALGQAQRSVLGMAPETPTAKRVVVHDSSSSGGGGGAEARQTSGSGGGVGGGSHKHKHKHHHHKHKHHHHRKKERSGSTDLAEKSSSSGRKKSRSQGASSTRGAPSMTPQNARSSLL
jgi:hypothetical protein